MARVRTYYSNIEQRSPAMFTILALTVAIEAVLYLRWRRDKEFNNGNHERHTRRAAKPSPTRASAAFTESSTICASSGRFSRSHWR